MIDTAIILAAGLGKRMRDFDPAIPKPLIKVNSKPFIQYSIDLLNEIKTKEIIINVHYKSDEILKFIKSLSQTNIIVSDESDLLLDTGGGIKKILNKYNINKSLVLNSDVIWGDSDKKLIVDMINSYPEKAEAFLGLVPKRNLKSFRGKGDFCKLKNNDLIRYDESSEPYVYIGAQIISKNAFNGIEKEVFSVNEAWNLCINKKTLKGYQFNTNALHLGTAELLKEYLRDDK
jgi:MurNAc alpha-1-phosphate uridylyltransferase|tara:strand:- start:272 stop:967 length:696 start_codon:yes stop_codon:yes gene_type:complete